ncbi:hypothetical protein MLD38_010763 [Melastoma candidum]|uniref:Uncharacterized protein n=1 Tax=Melastoma candidum TaxID=119954 RepID=A0ACB9R3Z4_9MYRT|nr:hypothetical protein MLD38_010763 [Melastoma candidum]
MDNTENVQGLPPELVSSVTEAWETEDFVSVTHMEGSDHKLMISEHSGLWDLLPWMDRMARDKETSLFSQTPEEYFGFVWGSRPDERVENGGNENTRAEEEGESSALDGSRDNERTDEVQDCDVKTNGFAERNFTKNLDGVNIMET